MNHQRVDKVIAPDNLSKGCEGNLIESTSIVNEVTNKNQKTQTLLKIKTLNPGLPSKRETISLITVNMVKLKRNLSEYKKKNGFLAWDQ